MISIGTFSPQSMVRRYVTMSHQGICVDSGNIAEARQLKGAMKKTILTLWQTDVRPAVGLAMAALLAVTASRCSWIPATFSRARYG